MVAMIIAGSRLRNPRFSLALRPRSATIRLMSLTRRHMIALSTAMLTFSARAEAVPLVFAASSLKTVLDDISKTLPMRLNYAGSGVLARQIIHGAPADLFISANPVWMAAVADAGRLDADPVPLLSNNLVLIASEPQEAFQFSTLPNSGHIAMGFTEAVPAGQYGKAAFQSLGLWSDIENQVVQTENVRAAMALVARGEVPWGVVYHTDAMADPSVHIVAKFPADTHPEIIYQAGRIKGSDTIETLLALTRHEAFARHGFIAL
jgi:molybdate transport system substrate-binding protein